MPERKLKYIASMPYEIFLDHKVLFNIPKNKKKSENVQKPLLSMQFTHIFQVGARKYFG